MITSNPARFAGLFNLKYPGASRKITTDDVHLMAECGLIGKYGCFLRQDLETARGILQYEQMRDSRSRHQDNGENSPICKICGQPLPLNPDGNPGLPREYCLKCESQRNRERQKKLRRSRRKWCPVGSFLSRSLNDVLQSPQLCISGIGTIIQKRILCQSADIAFRHCELAWR